MRTVPKIRDNVAFSVTNERAHTTRILLSIGKSSIFNFANPESKRQNNDWLNL